MGKGSKTKKIQVAAAKKAEAEARRPVLFEAAKSRAATRPEAREADLMQPWKRSIDVLKFVERAHAVSSANKGNGQVPLEVEKQVDKCVKEICDPTSADALMGAIEQLSELMDAPDLRSVQPEVSKAVKKYADDPEGPTVRATNVVMEVTAERVQAMGRLDAIQVFLSRIMGEERAAMWMRSFKGGVRYFTPSCEWCGSLQLAPAGSKQSAESGVEAGTAAEGGDAAADADQEGAPASEEDREAPFDYKKCSGCKHVWYCCEECQLLDWRMGGHSFTCKGSLLKARNMQPPSERRQEGGSLDFEAQVGARVYADAERALQEAQEKLQAAVATGGEAGGLAALKDAMDQLAVSNPEGLAAMRHLEFQKMMYDQHAGSRAPDRTGIRVLVQRLRRMMEGKDGRAKPEKDMPALACYCMHDEHFRCCWEEGAVELFRDTVDSDKCNSYARAVAAQSVTEPAMHPENRGPMIDAGYVEWAVQKLGQLPGSLATATGNCTGRAKEKLMLDMSLAFQAARLLAELAQHPEGNSRAVEAGAVEGVLQLLDASRTVEVFQVYMMHVRAQVMPQEDTKLRVWLVVRALLLLLLGEGGAPGEEAVRRLQQAGGAAVLARVVQWDKAAGQDYDATAAVMGREQLRVLVSLAAARLPVRQAA